MGQSQRSTELGLVHHGPLDVGGRHFTFLLIDAALQWMERQLHHALVEAAAAAP